MFRGEFSGVFSQLISKWLLSGWKWQKRVKLIALPLSPCKSWMFVKGNLDQKIYIYIYIIILKNNNVTYLVILYFRWFILMMPLIPVYFVVLPGIMGVFYMLYFVVRKKLLIPKINRSLAFSGIVYSIFQFITDKVIRGWGTFFKRSKPKGQKPFINIISIW